jgi:methylenetetrahydrofolate reductase (NADPH)
MLKDMRDEKKFQCGDEIDVEPRLFLGGAANPFADPFEFRVDRSSRPRGYTMFPVSSNG